VIVPIAMIRNTQTMIEIIVARFPSRLDDSCFGLAARRSLRSSLFRPKPTNFFELRSLDSVG
jgi:hypothetical protein